MPSPKPADVLLEGLAALDVAEPWRLEAACRDHPEPEIFHTPPRIGGTGRNRSTDGDVARGICGGCPVRWECLDARVEERYGIWGGYDEEERRAMQRQARRSA